MTSSVADRSSSEALLGTSQPLGRVYMALLCVQLSFSLHYFAAKMVLQEISAPTWAALRVTSGAVLMTLLVLPRLRKHFPSKSDLWKLFIFALFGVTFNQICFTEGLARTTATHSAIINSSIPVSTLLFAILLGRERFSLRKLISICFSLSGVLYLLKIEQLRFSDSQVIGDLL
ncbi:MAG: DMT family transporter, partial [Blastocatellia bacterium]|nr:DMT family transporter [Blastocatellia bacterium]